MAQNSSGKRGNAPQVAVVIGSGTHSYWCMESCECACSGRGYFEFVKLHSSFVERRVALAACLLPAGICCGRLNLESCRALRSLATMRRFAARAPTSASSAYAAESRITLASTLRWFALSRLFCSPHFPRWPRWRTWLLLFLCRRCEAAGVIRGVDFEPSRFRDIIG